MRAQAMIITCGGLWSGSEVQPAIHCPVRTCTRLSGVCQLHLSWISWLLTVKKLKQLIVQVLLARALRHSRRRRGLWCR